MQNENDRKILIEFVKESKIASLNKMNNSIFKLGTLLVFIIGSILYVIQNSPSKIPELSDYFIALTLMNYFIGAPLILFHFGINAIFRREHIIKNAEKNWNNLEIQYMRPIQIVSFIQSVVLILMILTMFIFCIYFEFAYWRIMLPNLALLYLLYFMSRNSIRKLNNQNSDGLVKKIISVIATLIVFTLPFYNFSYIVGIIYNHKLISLYSLYITGCYWVLLLISKTLSYRIIYSWIEDFYNEIHIKDLSYDDIKNKLRLEFTVGRNLETITYIAKNNEQFEEDDDIT